MSAGLKSDSARDFETVGVRGRIERARGRDSLWIEGWWWNLFHQLVSARNFLSILSCDSTGLRERETWEMGQPSWSGIDLWLRGTEAGVAGLVEMNFCERLC